MWFKVWTNNSSWFKGLKYAEQKYAEGLELSQVKPRQAINQLKTQTYNVYLTFGSEFAVGYIEYIKNIEFRLNF